VLFLALRGRLASCAPPAVAILEVFRRNGNKESMVVIELVSKVQILIILMEVWWQMMCCSVFAR
jgi:hypothetical protein